MADEILYIPAMWTDKVSDQDEVQLELPLDHETRISRLEKRREAHYKTTLAVQEELLDLRQEVKEMLAIFKSLKSVFKFMVVLGGILKWVAGIAVAVLTIKAVVTGHFRPNMLGE